jgi:hypothetical protein
MVKPLIKPATSQPFFPQRPQKLQRPLLKKPMLHFRQDMRETQSAEQLLQADFIGEELDAAVLVEAKKAESALGVHLNFVTAQAFLAGVEGETDLVFVREAVLLDQLADGFLSGQVVLLDESKPGHLPKQEVQFRTGLGEKLHQPCKRQIPGELQEDGGAYREDAVCGFVAILVVGMDKGDVVWIFRLHDCIPRKWIACL